MAIFSRRHSPVAQFWRFWFLICIVSVPPPPIARARSDQITTCVDQLARDLVHKAPDVRAKAAAKLKQMGAAALKAAPALVTRLGDDDERVARLASAALILSIGPRCAKDVAKGLSARKPRARRLAAGVLAAFGTQAKPAVPALIKSLRDPNPGVRAAAAFALGNVGDLAAIGPLVERTKVDTVSDVRDAAAGALQVFGAEAKSAIPSLVRMLADGSDDAAATLASIGDDAVPPLIGAIMNRQSTRTQRWMVLRTLRWMQAEDKRAAVRAVPAVTALLTDADVGVRQEAAVTLRGFHTGARASVPALTHALQDPDADVRLHAADALLAVDRTSLTAVPVLLRLLRHKDHNIRANAAEVLGRYADRTHAAVPALIRALADKDGRTRLQAVYALGSMGFAARTALAPLRQLGANDPSMRRYTDKAVANITQALRIKK